MSPTSMPKIMLYSVLALGLMYFLARSFGLTPEQVESQILLADLNVEEGLAYRDANSGRLGVVTLANGLQVEVLALGEGDVPAAEDWVEVHYRGWRIDGREFENSWRRGEPATVSVDRTIEGWRAALTSTPVGSRLRLVVPPALAYGRAGGGHIGPEETLVFELALLAIVQPDAQVELAEYEKPVPNLR